MPTSSQALILKNTDGPLHTAFGGRTHWRPAESWMDLFRRNDTSRNSFLFSKHPKRKNPPPRKAETAPNLRLDFATLPEILKISGIRGSFLYNAFECSTQMPYIRRIHGSYDHTINYPAPTNKDTLWSRHSVPNNFSDNAFEWTGHTTGYRALPNKATDWSHNSVPNNVNDKDFELSGHTTNYRTLKTKGTDWSRYPVPNNIGDSSRAWTDTGGRNETVYFIPQYRKVVKLNGKETAAQQDPRLYHTKTRTKGRELIKLEDREGHMELVKAPVEDAHYFRLQHIEGTEQGAFRLIKSEPNITGSFRLEKTDPQDVGDYRLIPADGYESDDFRLVTLDPKTSSFRLLQADPVDNRQYHIVTTAGEKNGQFRLIQAAQAAHRAWTTTPGTNETLDFIPQHRQTVEPCDEEFALHYSTSQGKVHELIRMENREGHMELVKVPVEDAHYFRLQHIEGTEEGTFRLIKSEPNATGSFRLECTCPQDVGDYHLVPADGYESDDFRLVTLDPKTSSFRLLQGDPVDNRQYYVVTTAGEQNGQFRFIQATRREADSHHNHSVEQYADAHSTVNYRLESRDTRETAYKATTPYKSIKNINLYNHASPTRFSEDRYDYFKDVLPQSDTDREELSPSFLPDITLYDSNNLTGRQNQRHSLNKQHSSDTKQSNLLSSDNEMDEFRQKYLDSYRDASPEVYNRLVSLGFKPAKTDKEHRQMKNIQQENAAIETPPRRTTMNTTLKQGLETRKPDARSNHLNVEWRTQNFENWTRTANTRGDDFYNFARYIITILLLLLLLLLYLRTN